MSVPCKIVLADDHTLFRNGLRTLLGGIEGFEVVAEASNGLELLELLERSLPDVVLLDIEMAQDQRHHRGCRRGARTRPGPGDHHVVHVRRRGRRFPHGVARRQGIHPEKLSISRMSAAAIEAVVVEGGSFFSQELLFDLVSNLEVGAFGRSGRQCRAAVAARVRDSARRSRRGESNNEIADAVCSISKADGRHKHRSNILAKTGCSRYNGQSGRLRDQKQSGRDLIRRLCIPFPGKRSPFGSFQPAPASHGEGVEF